MSTVCECKGDSIQNKTFVKKRKVDLLNSLSPNYHHSRVSSDILAYICTFLDDIFAICWYLTSKIIMNTGFIDKIALKKVYTFHDIHLFLELKKRLHQIRYFRIEPGYDDPFYALPPPLALFEIWSLFL